MLIDKDSKPTDTVFYLSVKLNNEIKSQGKIKISELEKLYEKIDAKQPHYKFVLALDFLYLLSKIQIKGDDLLYVH
ncbi:ABC-three component system middle component 6 [Exiguobacterium sp. MER 193]|uniref:ABC-three component system middle component 6 n=1 Tax=Exiguobacterium sp. MER 193 TaxID=2939564 RepID=UPI00333F0B22